MMACINIIILIITLLLFITIKESYSTDPTNSVSDDKVDKSNKKKSPHDKWRNLDEGKLSKEWEQGDEPDELEHELDKIKKVQNKKIHNHKFGGGGGGGGGAMIFIEIYKNNPQGKPWNKQSEAKLASKWKTMTRNGSLDVDVYNISDLKLMINLSKLWQLKDLMNFIALQPEVKSFRYNNKDYNPKDFLGDDDDDDL